MVSVTTPSTIHKTLSDLLINRDFALLWGGQAISTLGDAVFDTTLLLWIATRLALGQPWAPLAVSGLLLATSVPRLLVSPFAGVFVDRWDKRRTMMRMEALRAVLVVLLIAAMGIAPLPFFAGAHLPAIWQLGVIYAVVSVTTACAQFFHPSRLALIGDIVPEPLRAAAAGREQMTYSLVGIIGPPLAAPFLFVLGVRWALLVNALSFIVSFLAIRAMRAPRDDNTVVAGKRRGFWHEFHAGIGVFIRSRTVTTILISMALVQLGTGALSTLNVFFLVKNLHMPANVYGFAGAAGAAGAIVGAALVGPVARRLGPARTYGLALLGMGAIILVYARLTAFAPALVLLFLLGMMAAWTNVAVGPLVLASIPREFLGRVMSVFIPLISLAAVASVSVTGYLDSAVLRSFHAAFLGAAWTSVDTIFTGNGALIIMGGLYALVRLSSDARRITGHE